MNLINLFNFNYLKQNLKKSKGALAVFIGIIPIINILILFMLNDNNHSNEVITLPVLSIINFPRNSIPIRRSGILQTVPTSLV